MCIHHAPAVIARAVRSCAECMCRSSCPERMYPLCCAAVVPAGYYLKGPGQVAPCPQGEWKAGVGTDGNCTKCAVGIDTPRMASTSEADCSCKNSCRGQVGLWGPPCCSVAAALAYLYFVGFDRCCACVCAEQQGGTVTSSANIIIGCCH
jgi:hypothetical protein